MENFLSIGKIQLIYFIYLLVGYGLARKGILPAGLRKGISDILVYIFLPCMVFNSFLQQVGLQELLAGGQLLLISSSLCIVEYLLGRILYTRFSPERRAILRYGTLISNSGFIGLPMLFSAYGSPGALYASIYLIPHRIAMWTVGVSIMDSQTAQADCKKIFLNPSILAVALGLFRILFNVSLPSFLGEAIQSIGACTPPISMILVGAILSEVDIQQIFDKDAFFLSFVRLCAIPLLVLLVLRQLPIGPLPLATAVILSGMPIGSTTAILAQKYGADASFASACVFVSTILSIITIPLLSMLL